MDFLLSSRLAKLLDSFVSVFLIYIDFILKKEQVCLG
jgi:hypothetical protein